MTEDAMLKHLNELVGEWSTEATHPAMPGVVVRGTTTFEWLEGEQFLIMRARTDHPDFPDAISIVGVTDYDRADESGEVNTDEDAPLNMHYFDSRGVFRLMHVGFEDDTLRIWREAPGFSQRFIGKLIDDGRTVDGLWELCRDDINWNDDLKISYRRAP